jgi:hypothetical protein
VDAAMTRSFVLILGLCLAAIASAAEVESRRLTHYLPQDLLEKTVRTEDWAEMKLEVKGGILKGDIVRIWAGGSIDRGNNETPGEVTNGPDGAETARAPDAQFALSSEAGHAYALLFKTETGGVKKCLPAGKPLEIKMTKDGEKIWLGFNDERGRYSDNHLGKGRRHELDPAWVRIEIVRIVVD